VQSLSILKIYNTRHNTISNTAAITANICTSIHFWFIFAVPSHYCIFIFEAAEYLKPPSPYLLSSSSCLGSSQQAPTAKWYKIHYFQTIGHGTDSHRIPREHRLPVVWFSAYMLSINHAADDSKQPSIGYKYYPYCILSVRGKITRSSIQSNELLLLAYKKL